MKILHVLDHSIPLHSGYTFRTRSILKQQRLAGIETYHVTSPKHGNLEKEIEELVKSRLRLFFEYNILKYTNYKNYHLHIVGSIGMVYKELIKQVAKEFNVELDNVIQKPIDNLVSYHL